MKNKKEEVNVLSKRDWDSIEETRYLEKAGLLDKVRRRELDESGIMDVGEIDWDKLCTE